MVQSDLTDKPIPFQGVKDDLLGQIMSGGLRPGDKLQSTARLAAHYQVAVPTAHRALNELAKQGYLTRKTGVGTFVRQADVARVHDTVGAVIRCDGHIWSDFANSLLRNLRQLEVNTITVNVEELACDEIVTAPAFLQLMESLPATVIVQYTKVGEEILKVAPETHVISLEPNPGHRHLDMVAPDLMEVGSMAARHLIERGYRRVDLAGIFVTGEGPYRPSLETRTLRDGLDYELQQAGLPPANLVDIRSGDDASEHLRAYLSSAERAPAIVCSMAHRSAQLVRLARELGLRIPEDLALVSALESPWTEAYDLTAIDQRHGSIAELCVALINESRDGGRGPIRHRRAYTVAPQLVIRQST